MPTKLNQFNNLLSCENWGNAIKKNYHETTITIYFYISYLIKHTPTKFGARWR